MRWTSSRLRMVAGQPIRHPLAPSSPRGGDQPANAEGLSPLRPHFDRYLICRSTHAPRLHLHHRHGVVQSALEDFETRPLGAFLDQRKSVVKHPLGGRLLSTAHQLVYKRADEHAAMPSIRLYLSPRRPIPSRHWFPPLVRSFPNAYSDAGSLTHFEPLWRGTVVRAHLLHAQDPELIARSAPCAPDDARDLTRKQFPRLGNPHRFGNLGLSPTHLVR